MRVVCGGNDREVAPPGCVPVPYLTLVGQPPPHPLSNPTGCCLQWKSHSEHFPSLCWPGLSSRAFPSHLPFCNTWPREEEKERRWKEREEMKRPRALFATSSFPTTWTREKGKQLDLSSLAASLPQPSLGQRLRGTKVWLGLHTWHGQWDKTSWYGLLYGNDISFGWSCF